MAQSPLAFSSAANGEEATVSALIGAEPLGLDAGEQPQLKNGSATGEQSQDNIESALVSQFEEIAICASDDADSGEQASSLLVDEPKPAKPVLGGTGPSWPRRAAVGVVNKKQYRTQRKETKAIRRVERQLQSMQSQTAYQSFRAAGGDTTANTKEVEFAITDFFDYEVDGDESVPSILAYYFNTNQSYIGRGEGAFTRPVSCKVYVLPRAVPSAVAQNTFVALTAVRGLLVANSGEKGDAVLLNQQNTVINVDFKIDWKLVASWNERKLFSTTEIDPTFVGFAQELFRMQLINADTGTTYINSPVQVRVEIIARQTIPQSNVASIGTSYHSDWTSTQVTLSNSFVMVQPRRLTNVT